MITPVDTFPALGTRRERLRAQMRQEILTASRRILRESGFKDLSMRTLAQAVGVTAPTLYDYFQNKEGVLDALYDEGCARLEQIFRQSIAGTPVGILQLKTLAYAYRSFAHAEPDLFQLIFGRVDRSYIPCHPGKDKVKVLAELLVLAIAAAIKTGEVRPVDPNAACLTVWTAVHGFVTLEINGYLSDDYDGRTSEEKFQSTLDMLIDGFRA